MKTIALPIMSGASQTGKNTAHVLQKLPQLKPKKDNSLDKKYAIQTNDPRFKRF